MHLKYTDILSQEKHSFYYTGIGIYWGSNVFLGVPRYIFDISLSHWVLISKLFFQHNHLGGFHPNDYTVKLKL